MLDIQFSRNSAPATDAELLSVVDGIRPALGEIGHPFHDTALLLAKILLRIEELRAELAGRQAPAKVAA